MKAPACTLDDIQYGGQIYAYAPVNALGEPQTVLMDVGDAQGALAEAADFYYYCRNGCDDMHDWDEVLKHIGKEQKNGSN